MDKKQMQEKLAAIRDAKSKNSFPYQKDGGMTGTKATGTNSRGGGASGVRKIGSGD
ncbi:hypothetical protein [Lactovum miscens]|uniref:Uncharacterized protein n=1 Tax=Lactovum miscens TaxID=190387 RepID=A0A841C610_9LACT|nr:hypothetical protein [Lactovum miscens]MBB5887188.1 hypothetical protein [Lactovum miscens]